MAKEKTPRSKKSVILDVVLLCISICLFVASCFVFITRVYLSVFFVNGQSMWPTLNEFALNEKGEEVGQNGKSSHIGYTVECGLYNKHKGALKRLERFDIVVTHYPGFGDDEMIKRIIGLPGETIKFISGGENNGDLYINGEFIEQPINTEVIRSGTYPTNECVLSENEYYVCGDNRYMDNSYDSRSIGAIDKSYLVGKVVAVIGTGVIKADDDGKSYVKYSKIKKYRKVRFF